MNIIKNIYAKIIQKSRLDLYQNILRNAIDNGYIVTSLTDWIENDFYPTKRVFILRHDVDHDSEGAYKMYKIEKHLNVKSSFYYRWSAFNIKNMKKMHKDGFEVSLHFESLATYCKKHNLSDKSKLSDDIIQNASNELKTEIELFKNKFWNISTICSHGDMRNKILKTPNHIICANNKNKLGIKYETYDKILMDKIDCYISDDSINRNHNWKYGISPKEAINKGYQTICLLTHPIHWNYNIFKTIKCLYRSFKEDYLGIYFNPLKNF